MTPQDWPFADPPNVAVITSRAIINGRDWVYYASHDADDGAWQFHGPEGPCEEQDAVVVSLKSVVEADAGIAQLADLLMGWCAWRERVGAPWQRAAKRSLG